MTRPTEPIAPQTPTERAAEVLGAFLYPDEPTEDATRKGSEFLIRKLREGQ